VTGPSAGGHQKAGRPGRGGPAGAAGGADTGRGTAAQPGRSGPTRQLTFTRVDGTQGELTVQSVRDPAAGEPNGAAPTARRPPSPGGPLGVREVVDVNTSNAYVVKGVPRDAAGPDAYAAFDNEVQIGLHLARTILGAGAAYPREVSRLVGYNDAGEEPFLILAELGRPAGRYARRIAQGERFQASLMRALSILEAARVVHRNLTPGTVRWTESHVQIADFRHARLTGEPCGPAPSPAWSAPEARQQDAVADPAEDLWSAGLVIVHMLDGPRPAGSIGPPDLREVQAPDLDRTLDGVFRPLPRNRPPLDLVMADLNALREYVPPDAYPDPSTNDRRFQAGQAEFDQVSQNKALVDQSFEAPAGEPADGGGLFGDDW
jgi:hypothetical protein